jgi:hypothetical protein
MDFSSILPLTLLMIFGLVLIEWYVLYTGGSVLIAKRIHRLGPDSWKDFQSSIRSWENQLSTWIGDADAKSRFNPSSYVVCLACSILFPISVIFVTWAFFDFDGEIAKYSVLPSNLTPVHRLLSFAAVTTVFIFPAFVSPLRFIVREMLSFEINLKSLWMMAVPLGLLASFVVSITVSELAGALSLLGFCFTTSWSLGQLQIFGLSTRPTGVLKHIGQSPLTSAAAVTVGVTFGVVMSGLFVAHGSDAVDVAVSYSLGTGISLVATLVLLHFLSISDQFRGGEFWTSLCLIALLVTCVISLGYLEASIIGVDLRSAGVDLSKVSIRSIWCGGPGPCTRAPPAVPLLLILPGITSFWVWIGLGITRCTMNYFVGGGRPEGSKYLNYAVALFNVSIFILIFGGFAISLAAGMATYARAYIDLLRLPIDNLGLEGAMMFGSPALLAYAVEVGKLRLFWAYEKLWLHITLFIPPLVALVQFVAYSNSIALAGWSKSAPRLNVGLEKAYVYHQLTGSFMIALCITFFRLSPFIALSVVLWGAISMLEDMGKLSVASIATSSFLYLAYAIEKTYFYILNWVW